MTHHFYAGVAELVDALDLGSSVFDVGVQVPSPVPFICGSSSVVEYDLAKVGVAGSNPVFRFFFRGLSSAGRAPALHAGGQRFDPARLHQFYLKILSEFRSS